MRAKKPSSNNLRILKLAVWGAGGHAKVVSDIARQTGKFEIIGYIDNTTNAKSHSNSYFQRCYSSLEQLLNENEPDAVIIAIGNANVRRDISRVVDKANIAYATLIHPNAYVAQDVKIGEGTVVMAGAVINSSTSVGKHSIVNTSASVDHDCTLGSFVHIAPGAHLGGWVTVSDLSHVGLGSSVRDRINIGKSATVGTGAALVQDVPDNAVFYGNPAKNKLI